MEKKKKKKWILYFSLLYKLAYIFTPLQYFGIFYCIFVILIIYFIKAENIVA